MATNEQVGKASLWAEICWVASGFAWGAVVGLVFGPLLLFLDWAAFTQLPAASWYFMVAVVGVVAAVITIFLRRLFAVFKDWAERV